MATEKPVDEFFEHDICQVAGRAKLAMDGLSMLLLGIVEFLELPELRQMLREEYREELDSTNIEELKEKIAKFSTASQALEYLQTKEALRLLSIVRERKDIFNMYAHMTLGFDKVLKFLQGKSSL